MIPSTKRQQLATPRHRFSRVLRLLLFLAFLNTALPSSSSSSSSSRTFRSTSTEKIRLGLEKTLFVVVSQENEFHARSAQRLRENLKSQAKTLLPTASIAALPTGGSGGDLVSVLLTHEIDDEETRQTRSREDSPQFLHRRAWTILPLLPHILAKWGGGGKARGAGSPTSAAPVVAAVKTWVFFLQDDTVVDLRLLLRALARKDPAKDAFMGRPLVDRRPTIIHHYAFHDDVEAFRYPDFGSGFFLSMPLIKTLVPRWTKERKGKLDFAIDTKHELAKFVWNQGKGITMQEMGELCGGENTSSTINSCATFYKGAIPDCRHHAAASKNDNETVVAPSLNAADVVVAVKTYRGFHSSRIPVVKNTWEREVLDAKIERAVSTNSNEVDGGWKESSPPPSPSSSQLIYFSDLKDDAIPTKDLGVENTQRGHCAKTIAIFQFYAKEYSRSFKWLAIVDDDTLLSFRRLVSLLSCYDSKADVALGERYGYGLDSDYGYDYITGGGGMVFSPSLVQKLAECQCRKPDAPDDMHIGMCLASLDIPVVHSARFHQARPMDYAKDYLHHTRPVSFHKHEEHDPVLIWRKYLDAKLDVEDDGSSSLSSMPTHDEL